MAISEMIRINPGEGGRNTLADWREKLNLHSHGLDVQSARSDLTGEVLKFDFAGATLWSVQSGPQLMRRVRASAGGSFRPMAIVHMAGSMSIAQGQDRCELSSGSFCYIDSATPHEIEYDGDFRQLVLQFPATTFRSAVYRKALGKRMDASEPLNAAFFQCVQNIWAAASEIHPLRHSSALAALISLSHMTTAMQAAENERELPIRVAWAMEFVEQNVGNFDLCPQMVADAQGVSRRYLDALFMTRGHRLQTWIWERRLIRAAEDLRLNNDSDYTILQAALDHGFKTPSHFSRAFAKKFGIPPRQYRREFGLPN